MSHQRSYERPQRKGAQGNRLALQHHRHLDEHAAEIYRGHQKTGLLLFKALTVAWCTCPARIAVGHSGEFRLIFITPGASAPAGNASKTASTNREKSMRHFLATTSALTFALLVGGQAVAQQPPAQPLITRTVVAAMKLPTVTDRPLLFRALSVTIPPGEKSSVSTANGILYQISGSTDVTISGGAKTLSPGEGLFLAEGTPASLKAGTVEAAGAVSNGGTDF